MFRTQIINHPMNLTSSLEKSKCESFPKKLYELLESLDKLGFSDAAVWLPHGRAFSIIDKTKFMNYAVPMFFKQTKIRSFTRQLNLWGFKRLSRGRDAGGWFHKHFLRGEPDEIDNIIRVKIKSKAAIESSNDLDEEEFYAMPPLSAPASAMHGDTYSISRMINCSVPSQPPEGQCDSPCHVGSGSANLSLSRQVLNAPAEQSALALYQQAPSQVLSLPPNFMTEGYRRFVSDTHNAVVANDCHSQYAPADMHTHLVSPVDSPNHQRRVFQGDVDGFEPLPFEEDSLSDSIERDEFSHFIDSVIPNL